MWYRGLVWCMLNVRNSWFFFLKVSKFALGINLEGQNLKFTHTPLNVLAPLPSCGGTQQKHIIGGFCHPLNRNPRKPLNLTSSSLANQTAPHLLRPRSPRLGGLAAIFAISPCEHLWRSVFLKDGGFVVQFFWVRVREIRGTEQFERSRRRG